MKRFLKLLFRFMLIVPVCVLWYVVLDPFMVIRHYDDYYKDGFFKNCPNDAFRGMRQIEKQNFDYNAFIVGSSRSSFYYAEDWEEYIGNNDRIIHFSQSGANLLGDYQRIAWLSKNVQNLDHLLLIVDHASLNGVLPNRGHLYVEPYQITGISDFLSFHYDFFSAFFTAKCQVEFISSIFNHGHLKSKMPAYEYYPYNNELHKSEVERMISTTPEGYYGFSPDVGCFYLRDTIETVLPKIIKEKQKYYLEAIYEILMAKKTDYKIIVSPLYDQRKLNPTDVGYLKSLFGEDNVFDFSGINEMTSNTLNYYETSHYRPCLCREIMKIVYSGQEPAKDKI